MRETRSLRGIRMAAAVLTASFAGAPAAAQPSPTAPAQPGPAAPAQPSPATPVQAPLVVEWKTNDAACDGSDVRQRALALVASGVVPRPLTAKVDVARQQDEWLVKIETQSADREHAGRREFRAESCEHLEQAVALLLAMTLESGDLEALLPPPAPTAGEPVAPPAASPPPTPLEPEEPPDDPPPSRAPEDPGVPLGWFVRLDGRAGLGLKPGLAFGVGLAGGVRVGPLDLGVVGTYWPVTKEPVPGADNAYTLIQRASAGLRACWSFELGGFFALAPCVIPEAVVFITGAEGINNPDDGPKAPIPSVAGALELRYAPGGGHLSVLLGAAISVEQRQPFQLRPQNIDEAADADAEPVTVYETKGVGPRLEIGLDARF